MPPDTQRLQTAHADPATLRSDDPAGASDVKGITAREIIDIEERAQPRTPVLYEVVRRMGEEELARPAVSLFWSGVAAGLSMSFSLIA